jgi:hypothetical protein
MRKNEGRRSKWSRRTLLLKRCLTFLASVCAVQKITQISWFSTTGGSFVAGSPGFSRTNLSLPLVAIVCCTKSTKTRKVADFIEHHLLPSIYRTISLEERAKFRVELMLGYDHDDDYWRLENNHQLSPKNDKGVVLFNDHDPIPIKFFSIRKDPNNDRPDRIPFNELCQAAFDYGATYILRVNDDTEFLTAGWVTAATQALASFSPPNVGVVGPDDLPLHQPFLTHDMVHAPTHYSIFDSYYPNDFDNYFVDDWIANVYGKERTVKVNGWEIFHHHKVFCGASRCERYKPSYRQKNMLKELLIDGRDRLTRKLSEMTTLDVIGGD